jgi:hypothetical protein
MHSRLKCEETTKGGTYEIFNREWVAFIATFSFTIGFSFVLHSKDPEEWRS